MASQTSTHCGGSGGGRRRRGTTTRRRRHPHLSPSSHRHSFTLHNSKEEGSKGGRKEGWRDGRQQTTAAVATQEVFPLSLSSSLLLQHASSLPLSHSKSPLLPPLLSSADAGCEKREILFGDARARADKRERDGELACVRECVLAPFGLAREIRSESRELQIQCGINNEM